MLLFTGVFMPLPGAEIASQVTRDCPSSGSHWDPVARAGGSWYATSGRFMCAIGVAGSLLRFTGDCSCVQAICFLA